MKLPNKWSMALIPLVEAGANILGACCGSTPEHIRAFRKELDGYLSSKQLAGRT